MGLSLLEMAQNISDQMDHPQPSTISGDLSNRQQRRLRENIQRAYHFVYNRLNKQAEDREGTGTITLVAGTESYNFPSGMTTITQLQYGDEVPLRIIPWDEFERYKQDNYVLTETGSPYIATLYSRQVWFYPVPDNGGTVNVRGNSELSDLSGDNDEPDLPDVAHRAIQDYALYLEMIYQGHQNAGVLVTSEGGQMQAQGGQAATFLAAFKAAKGYLAGHMLEPPRAKGIAEVRRYQKTRRIIKVQS